MLRPLIWPADETEDQQRIRYLEDRVNFLEQNNRVRLGNSDAVLMDDLGNVTVEDDSDHHNIVGSRHTVTGAVYALVGVPSVVNTLGLITPVTNVGANQIPIGGTAGAITWNGAHRFINTVGIGDDPVTIAVLGIQHPTILDTALLYGLNIDFEHTASTTPAELFGASIFVSRNSGSGIPLALTGLEVRVNHSALLGTLPTLTHIKITGFVNSSTITTTYGIYIDDISGGTQTNVWSIYALDVNAPSYFAGDVLTGTATAVAGAQVTVAGGNISLASGNFVDALTDGSTGGFRAGSTTDVLLYRSAADTWRTPDALVIDTTLTVTGLATVGGLDSTVDTFIDALTNGSTGGFRAGTATDVVWYRDPLIERWYTPDAVAIGSTLSVTGLTTLAGVTATAGTFISAITDGSTGGFKAGVLGDVVWYRSATDQWRTPDDVIVGPGGTGTAATNLAIDSGSGSGGQPAFVLQRNSVTKGLLGVAGAAGGLVTGSAVDDTVFRGTQDILFSADGGTTLHFAVQNNGRLKVGPKSFMETTAEKTVTTVFTTIYTIPAASSAGIIFVNGTDASAGTASVTYMAVVYWNKSSDTVDAVIEEKVNAATASLQFSGDNLQIKDDGGGFFNTCKVVSIWSQNG
mgnify:CR=1 FL=1